MIEKEGFGSIFKNNQKKNDKSPDYTGHITLNGKEIRLSCWLATSKQGTKYFQVRASSDFMNKAPDEKLQNAADNFLNDKVPF